MRLFENIYAVVCFATLKPTHRLRGWAGHSFLALSDGFLELETSRLLSKQQEKAIPVYYTHTYTHTKVVYFGTDDVFPGFCLSVRPSICLPAYLCLLVESVAQHQEATLSSFLSSSTLPSFSMKSFCWKCKCQRNCSCQDTTSNHAIPYRSKSVALHATWLAVGTSMRRRTDPSTDRPIKRPSSAARYKIWFGAPYRRYVVRISGAMADTRRNLSLQNTRKMKYDYDLGLSN